MPLRRRSSSLPPPRVDARATLNHPETPVDLGSRHRRPTEACLKKRDDLVFQQHAVRDGGHDCFHSCAREGHITKAPSPPTLPPEPIPPVKPRPIEKQPPTFRPLQSPQIPKPWHPKARPLFLPHEPKLPVLSPASRSTEGILDFDQNRQAAQLFTRAALEQTQVDAVGADGNPVGASNDLGEDGAFKGLKIVVVKIHTSTRFTKQTFEQTVSSVLGRKGFDVVVLEHDKLSCNPADKGELGSELVSANQLWLISDKGGGLPSAARNSIVDRWRKGMALYIFGENDPFFAEANELLTQLQMPHMSGDHPGREMIAVFDDKNPRRGGFVQNHLITTGINRLYEGNTVAEMDPKALAAVQMEVVVHNSRGMPLVALRPASTNGGQIIVDGAFTKLYCETDAAGSQRLWVNCACYLAADFAPALLAPSADAPPEPKTTLRSAAASVSTMMRTCDAFSLKSMPIELGAR